MKKLIVVAGPTASGKTAVSVKIAKQLGGEIISADSMQIYKTLDIGTAKTTSDEMCGIPHHLLDIVSPLQNYSVAEYAKAGKECIEQVFAKDKTPIICGGTGLYINSLLYKRSFGKSIGSERVREKYENILLEKGKEFLFSLLEQIDLESSEKLHPNDTRRVVRALEIFELTGRKKSDQNDSEELLYDVDFYCLNTERSLLYERINNRVDLMIKQGLLDEVSNLYKTVDLNSQCFTAIGYKEFLPYFRNEITLNECIDKIKQDSRNYAKRQLTWFRNQKHIVMIETSLGIDKIVEQICNRY